MKSKKYDEQRDEEAPERLSEEVGRHFLRRLLESGRAILVQPNEEGEKPVGRFTLPKELINYLFNQMDRGKNEIVSIIGREFNHFLNATDLSEELKKVLSEMSIEVKAEINFKPKKTKKRTTTTKTTVKKKPANKSSSGKKNS